MKVHKKISRLRSYFEAVWVSARFYSMFRKMNRLRAEGTENRQEIFWSILCSLMSVRGIFTFISGYVEMMEGNAGGIKMMMEGTGTAMTAATVKQYGGVLMGTEMKEKRGLKNFRLLLDIMYRSGKEK